MGLAFPFLTRNLEPKTVYYSEAKESCLERKDDMTNR